MRRIRHAILLGLLFTAPLLSPNVGADTVVLKNGKKFEGIVKKESPTEVTINIGLGTVSFKREQIARVDRSEGANVEKAWQRELITRGKFVPEGLNDFAEKFSVLENSRNLAARARLENARIQRHRTELFNEIKSIQQEISGIARQFQTLVPEQNIQQYNGLVKRQNRLATRAILIKDNLQQDTDQANSNRELISGYLNQLDRFKKDLAREKSASEKKGADNRAEMFFASIDQRVEKYTTEFEQIEVPHQGARDHMLVTVRLNDRVDGLFLLDTGATYVTLSSAVADSLGIGLSPDNNVSVSLANGSSVAAQPVILDSMQAGDARVDGVIAMVFPEPPHPGVDGLLGMSFLREFTIHLDPVNNKLVLQKFDPD